MADLDSLIPVYGAYVACLPDGETPLTETEWEAAIAACFPTGGGEPTLPTKANIVAAFAAAIGPPTFTTITVRCCVIRQSLIESISDPMTGGPGRWGMNIAGTVYDFPADWASYTIEAREQWVLDRFADEGVDTSEWFFNDTHTALCTTGATTPAFSVIQGRSITVKSLSLVVVVRLVDSA